LEDQVLPNAEVSTYPHPPEHRKARTENGHQLRQHFWKNVIGNYQKLFRRGVHARFRRSLSVGTTDRDLIHNFRQARQT